MTIPWEDKITNRQQEILIGSLLGDGRLECRSVEGRARFRVHHADSQKDLLFWKYKEFKELVLREPWIHERLDKRYNRFYKSWFFHTVTTKLFTPLYRLFYNRNKKCVPRDIVKYLTPLACAVWIADDGCRTDHELILNTQSFTLTEQEILLNAISKRFDVNGTINKDRNNFRLRFNTVNAIKLRDLIQQIDMPLLHSKLVPVTTNLLSNRLVAGIPIREN